MNNTQQGILAPVPGQARYMIFSLRSDTDPRHSLKQLADIVDDNVRPVSNNHGFENFEPDPVCAQVRFIHGPFDLVDEIGLA